MKDQSREIAQLKQEVAELKKQMDGFMSFVGYNGNPYRTVVKAKNVTIINHGKH